jgi:hypothetical protein
MKRRKKFAILFLIPIHATIEATIILGWNNPFRK